MSRRRGDVDNLTKVNAIALMEKMLDLTESHKKELEDMGANIYKDMIVNSASRLKMIANTARNSVANDLFIDALNRLKEEIYDEFPHAPTLHDLIVDAMKLYEIAFGKDAQGGIALFDNTLLKSFEGVSFQQRPEYLYYNNPKKRRKTKTIIYED